MQNDITPIQQELDTLVKIIIETVPVEQIYLFGSYAYGTPHKDSDKLTPVVFAEIILGALAFFPFRTTLLLWHGGI